MDYSSANMSLWNIIIQLGLIAGVILLSQFLRSKLSFVRKSMMPVAVLGGFILLILKYLGVVKLDAELLEMLVYHCIALGFIAMSLRTTGGQKSRGGQRIGLRSGALIVSTYLVQGVAGLIITMGLAYTFMPGLFKAAGLLLPMGYGQGPGQANNIGGSYEAMGFAGGQSFGLAIAASGYLCACIVGVIMLNILSRRHKITPRTESKGSRDLSVGFFQDNNELPVSDSIDRLSVQFALILLVYLLTYLLTKALAGGVTALAPGLTDTVNTLLWGFNFVVGSAVAMLVRLLLNKAQKSKIIEHQ